MKLKREDVISDHSLFLLAAYGGLCLACLIIAIVFRFGEFLGGLLK